MSEARLTDEERREIAGALTDTANAWEGFVAGDQTPWTDEDVENARFWVPRYRELAAKLLGEAAS